MTMQTTSLPPLVVELVQDGYLDDALLPAEGLSAKVTYSELAYGDTVQVTWYAVDTRGVAYDWDVNWELSPADPAYDDTKKTLSLKVPASFILPAVGGYAFFTWYHGTSGSINRIPSQRLVIALGRLPPVVQVRHSHQLQIAPELSTGSIEISWPPYAAMRHGDIATLVVVFNPQGNSSQTKRYPHPVAASEVGLALSWQVDKTLFMMAQAAKWPIDIHVELQLGGNTGPQVAFAKQRFTAVAADELPPREAPVELGTTHSMLDVLDPANFPQGLEVQVPPATAAAVVQRGDVALLRVLGTRDDEDLYEQVVTDLSTGKAPYLGITIPQTWLYVHDGQQVTLEWQLDRAGGSVSGEPRVVEIKAARTLTYPNVPAATPEEADGDDFNGFIEPAKFRASGIRVEVPEDFALAPDEVLAVHYEGDPAGGRYQTTQPISADQPRAFLIPPQYLAPSMGGEAKRAPVYYEITLANGTLLKSPAYRLWVKPLSSSALINIQCPQAPGGSALSIAALRAGHNGQADIVQPAWPLMAQGQRLNMTAKGVMRQNPTTEIEFSLFDSLVPAIGPVETKLPVSFLDQLQLNSTFYVFAEVAFDTTNFILRQSTAIRLVA